MFTPVRKRGLTVSGESGTPALRASAVEPHHVLNHVPGMGPVRGPRSAARSAGADLVALWCVKPCSSLGLRLAPTPGHPATVARNSLKHGRQGVRRPASGRLRSPEACALYIPRAGTLQPSRPARPRPAKSPTVGDCPVGGGWVDRWGGPSTIGESAGGRQWEATGDGATDVRGHRAQQGGANGAGAAGREVTTLRGRCKDRDGAGGRPAAAAAGGSGGGASWPRC